MQACECLATLLVASVSSGSVLGIFPHRFWPFEEHILDHFIRFPGKSLSPVRLHVSPDYFYD